MANDEIERRPAHENPWYVLMTIAGEQGGEHSWEIDATKVVKNRHFWHGWLWSKLSDPTKDELRRMDWFEGTEWRELSPSELATIDRRFSDANLTIPSTPIAYIDLEGLIFEKMFSVEGFCFPFMFGAKNSVFNRPVKFAECRFLSSADFKNCRFNSVFFADECVFEHLVTLRHTTFGEKCNITRSHFLNRAVFQDANFKASTSFANCEFKDRVPEFYNTRLHEDTVWKDVDWPQPPSQGTEAEEHRRAYERLKLQMDGQKKTHDEHMFHRKELRCREVEEGFPKNLPSRAYGVVAEYGWNFVRPALWLAGLIVLGWVWIGFWFMLGGSCPAEMGGPNVGGCFWSGLGVSFSNTFGFLGLGRQVLSEEINSLNDFGWFEFGATVQFVLGPVFLFFVLLALRNRYRMR